MQRYRLEVGHQHKVRPGNIVGAIANETGLESKHIGRITIFEDYSLVDLPEGMPGEIFQHLKNTYVAGRRLKLSLYKSEQTGATKPGKESGKKSSRKTRKPKSKDVSKGAKKKKEYNSGVEGQEKSKG